MAEPSGLLNQNQQNSLRSAVTGKDEFNLGGMGLNIPSAVTSLGTAVINNPVVSNIGALANVARGTYDENLASKVVNPDQGIFSSIAKSSLPSFISGKSSLDTMKERADMNRDGIVDNTEYDAYSYNFGKNLATPTVQRTNLTPMGDITRFNNAFENINRINLTAPQQNFSSYSNTPMGVGTTGNLGSSTGVGYTSGFFGGLGFGDSGESTGIDTSTSAATAGQDTATSGPTGTSYADDAQSSDTGGGGGTYICTALYEMGDMKKSIYKYDQIYGKQVDPATYRGYELWGKYVATKLRKKGIVYKIAKPIALTWANQMAYDLSKGKIGKNSLAIKITKTIGEGICYALGQIFKRRQLWLKSQ
jgi:hypothetical protein